MIAKRHLVRTVPRGWGVNFCEARCSAVRCGNVSSITQSAAIHDCDRHYRRSPMAGRWERKVHARTWVGVTACTKGMHVLSVRCEFRVAPRLQSTCRRPGPIRYQALGTHGSGVRTLPGTLFHVPTPTTREPEHRTFIRKCGPPHFSLLLFLLFSRNGG